MGKYQIVPINHKPIQQLTLNLLAIDTQYKYTWEAIAKNIAYDTIVYI